MVIMINRYYVIEDKKYLDAYLLRETFQLSKSSLQHLMTLHSFQDGEVISFQNKKLYSVEALRGFIKNVVDSYELK
jgi:hypothetical protein